MKMGEDVDEYLKKTPRESWNRLWSSEQVKTASKEDVKAEVSRISSLQTPVYGPEKYQGMTKEIDVLNHQTLIYALNRTGDTDHSSFGSGEDGRKRNSNKRGANRTKIAGSKNAKAMITFYLGR